MDKDDFVNQAIGDLVQPDEKPVVEESTSKDAMVNMAMEDLTGKSTQPQVVQPMTESKPVDSRPPDHKNIDLEEAFNKSVTGQNESIDENEEQKDTLAQDIAEAGADVLEKTLKNLR